LFHIVTIWACYISSCKFCITTKSYAFRILAKIMGFALLHFELSVSHCYFLNLELFYCCCLFSTSCVWRQLQNFPKLNHQVFLPNFVLLINLVFFLWNCLWSLCVTIVLITNFLDFSKALNYKLFVLFILYFACVYIFRLVIKVCVLWFHVFVFLTL
jgi:hypothetical protein